VGKTRGQLAREPYIHIS